MVHEDQMLTETEQRYTERRTEREKGVQAIRAGHILQADRPDRVRARLRRLGINERVVETIASTRRGIAAEDISQAVVELGKRRGPKAERPVPQDGRAMRRGGSRYQRSGRSHRQVSSPAKTSATSSLSELSGATISWAFHIWI